MGTQIVHRPARVTREDTPREVLTLAPAPTIEEAGQSAGMMMRAVVPLIGGLGLILIMISSGNMIRMIAGCAMITAAFIGVIAMIIHMKTGARKKAEQKRTQYIAYLDRFQKDLAQESEQQRAYALRRHPAPEALVDVVREPTRLWERRRSDADFLVLRVGRGVGPLARRVDLRDRDEPLSRPEPVAQAHLERVKTLTERIDGLPVAAPFRGIVSIVGAPEETSAVLRAALTQLVSFHAPDDVGIHLCQGDSGRETEWMMWLPHLLDQGHFDGPLGRRQVSADAEDAAHLLDEIADRRSEIEDTRSFRKDTQVERRNLVVVIDGNSRHGQEIVASMPPVDMLERLRLTLVVRVPRREREPSHVDTRVMVEENGLVSVDVPADDREDSGKYRRNDDDDRKRRLVRGATRGSADVVPRGVSESIARRLAPLRLVEDATPDAPLESTVTLDTLLGVDNFATYDIEEMWAPRPLDSFLNVPFGVDSSGAPVYLDLKESAQEGMGPHGLCVGATGSGKSEVMRTIVLAQAVSHPPERLSLVLVDYKGGAAFSGLDALPHTAAMVDNLSDDDGLVDRLHDAMLGELQRRQRVLQAAGSLPNITEYNRRREAGQDLDPLPNLFVVIDEFGEMLAAKPEFAELFVQIGRIGRSVGVHLLLASQRLESGKLKGLESHLSYRLGLRTFSAQESKTVIGTADAHELPPIPGSGILKVDPDIHDRFRAAYVSSTYVPPVVNEADELPPVPMPFEMDNTTEDWLTARQQEYAERKSRERGEDRDEPLVDDPFSETTLDLVAQRLAGAGTRVRQMWLPPLPDSLDLGAIVGAIETTADRGLQVVDADWWGSLRIPLGRKDDPLRQWQGPLEVDVRGAGGHVAILGAPQSGRSTAIRSFVVGSALTHTPRELGFYLIDMAGSGLKVLEDLPHVGDVATRFESDKLRRTVAEISMMLTVRERLFAEYQIESAEHMREMFRAGELTELPVADVFLVIDGWQTFKEEFDDLAPLIQEIGSRGLGYGIHLMWATGRWADFRVQMQSIIGTKVELRLNDPLDSTFGKKNSQKIKAGQTGRALTDDTLLSQVALPRFGGELTNVEATVRAISDAWTGRPVPVVRMLPDEIRYDDLRAQYPEFPDAIIGLGETDLMPVRLDLFGAEPHLIVFGSSGTGRTSLVRTILAESMRGRTGQDVIFVVVDLKRQLLGAVPDEYDGAYIGTSKNLSGIIGSITKELDNRVPPDDVTADQLRNRSWWSGPDIVFLADDYDLVEGSNGPLRQLVPYLPQARDLGLHMVVLRRSGGAGRAVYEPLIQALKENGAGGLLLDGDRQEGQIWPNTRLARRPPGRGTLVRRSGKKELIQLALYDDPHDEGNG